MVQVNLIAKKRKQATGPNWIVVVTLAVFGGLVAYFLWATFYVIINLYQVNSEQKQVDDEAVSVSAAISANQASLGKYVLTKYILEQMAGLKSARFRYKDYLDQINGLMPAKATLTNVDFAEKGWVAVAVSLPGVSALKAMEANLADTTKLTQGGFSQVLAESVSEDKTGLYVAKLHFGINTNGGK